MFGKSFKIFSLFGFKVEIDFTWVILAILIVWSLSTQFFPAYYEGLSTTTYLWMGIIGAVGLFLSIIFHEFSHSIVARKFDIPIKGITLFIFGGVAQMNEEPKSAKSELYMAIAGPIASLIIGGLFFGLGLISASYSGPVFNVLRYLAIINFALAGFNLIPAFPLDGGRVLRAILWSIKDNLRAATKTASQIGSGFATLLIVFGALNFIGGNFVGGVWYFLIGLFLNTISKNSYQQLLMREALQGERVEKFMNKKPVVVQPSVSLDEFVQDYVYEYHYKFFPVVQASDLKGCITVGQIKRIPREEWKNHTVGELATNCSGDNTIEADEDANKALSTMRRTNKSRLMVVKNNQLVGIVTLKDMLEFLSLKADLERE